MDLFSYLLGKKSGGGGGEKPIVPTTKTELTNEIQNSGNEIINALFSTKNNYIEYVGGNITLYTPNIKCKGYMIQKRSNGKYRIVWGDYDYIRISGNSSQSFVVTKLPDYPNFGRHLFEMFNFIFQDNTNDLSANNFLSYYSNEFNSLEELVQAIQNPDDSNIIYTEYTIGLSFGGVIDSTYTMPITNLILFDNNWNIVSNATVLSKNEEIITYPS